ncbi:MAG: spirocyclase AveC family protein [Mycolicibacterium sp.]|uniref:DUF5135 domain-containing protein n=2 Tax=Mycolicibacterium insubricum TaxID=444597 RepID=A0A1X0D787_9MYCO|nr:spirocyclase AveC family protein [Mycolicibacterium sp.]MCV7081549.1 spirocyclase AveC family protein [Mycolicibacterium insubricum]ORA68032.1 hypothetical protein BST26_15120 [Mycolicibacterium insubricum]
MPKSSPAAERDPAELPPLGRQGPATFLALVGICWTVFAAIVLVRWVTSGEDFTPVPRLGPDVMPDWRLIALRIFEAISLAVLAAFVWYCVVRPLRTTGKIGLDGKFVIGGLVCFVVDGFLNVQEYLFAWNSANVNRGVWVRFLPFHNPDAPTRYAESLIWGPPMYVYFAAGVAIVACHEANRVRRRWPDISKFQLLVAIFVFEFLFDFVVENIAIRTTHAYAYAKTYEPLTLWAGEVHQFPLYESFLVACVGCMFTWARMEAQERPLGQSPIEVGAERWRSSLAPHVRNFAVIGFCILTLALLYHLPFNWLGVIGTSYADLPSYLMPSP